MGIAIEKEQPDAIQENRHRGRRAVARHGRRFRGRRELVVVLQGLRCEQQHVLAADVAAVRVRAIAGRPVRLAVGPELRAGRELAAGPGLAAGHVVRKQRFLEPVAVVRRGPGGAAGPEGKGLPVRPGRRHPRPRDQERDPQLPAVAGHPGQRPARPEDQDRAGRERPGRLQPSGASGGQSQSSEPSASSASEPSQSSGQSASSASEQSPSSQQSGSTSSMGSGSTSSQPSSSTKGQ